MNADVHAFAGAYALDALPEDERRFFEAHLAVCEPCRQEVSELQQTAVALGAAAEEPPPPELRTRVLTMIDRIRQDPPVVSAPARERGGWLRSAALAVAAVLAIAVVGLAAVVGSLRSRLDVAEATTVAIASVLSAPDASTVVLDGSGGHASVVLAASTGQGVVLADDLDAPAAGRAYALWIIRGDQPTLAAMFEPDTDGRVAAVVTGDLQAVDALGVTVEASDAPPRAPTGEIVMLGTVT